MKYIEKTEEPIEFINWKNKFNAGFSEISGKPKKNLSLSLIIDQGYICCYCEKRILPKHEGKYDNHIEHLRPQKKFPNEALDYNNLLVSCQRDPLKRLARCGHAKGGKYDKNMVSPLNKDCGKRFRFDPDGFIKPTSENDINALETIKMLNLNSERLKAWRMNAIEIFENIYDRDEISNKLDSIKEKNEKGHFIPFYTTIFQLLDKKR